MLKVRSNRGSLNGQKTSVKKSAKKKLTKQDASILTETTVWDPVFDGNALQYAFLRLTFWAFLVLNFLGHITSIGSQEVTSNLLC